ncbi:MAG: carboxylating nicotinate-nucleotide diphosphorylase [Bacteroidota bacterium]
MPLPPSVEDALDRLVPFALSEDIGAGDITTEATIPPGTPAVARFRVKEPGVIAGMAVAERVFAAVDPDLETTWHASDGDRVAPGDEPGEVRGRARSILVAERLALNLIQRMGGIATAARRMADAAHPATILDTRKTAPGLRHLDKWAVSLGGAANHRTGLWDMVLIKDNHIAAAGGVRAALFAATEHLRASGREVPVECETRALTEVDAALQAHADGARLDRLLLDNMAVRTASGLDVSRLREAVERVDGRVQTEASGNVTLETVAAIAETGVDFISSGALTHSVRALDVSLKVVLGE